MRLNKLLVGSQHKTCDITVEDIGAVWRKSARRKRTLALKLNKQGQLIVMTPMRSTLTDVRELIISRRNWIDTQLSLYAQIQKAKDQAQGQTIWMLGEPLVIESAIASKNSITQSNQCLQVKARQTLSKKQIDHRVRIWQIAQAKHYLQARCQDIESKTGMTAQSYQVKQFSARWGSCQPEGVIKLNWRLIMVPPQVIDYVIVHELCHLTHFNHSRQFWHWVEKNCPDFKQHRLWLKQQGRLLMAL